MNISFSTICPVKAEHYLDDVKYNYLSIEQRKFILKNISTQKLRVQDPLMYSNPTIEFQNIDIFEEYTLLCENEDQKLLNLLKCKSPKAIEMIIKNNSLLKNWKSSILESILYFNDNYAACNLLIDKKLIKIEDFMFLHHCSHWNDENFILWFKSKTKTKMNVTHCLIENNHYKALGLLIKHKQIAKSHLKFSLKYFHSSKFSKKEISSFYNKVLAEIK